MNPYFYTFEDYLFDIQTLIEHADKDGKSDFAKSLRKHYSNAILYEKQMIY